MQLSSHCSIVDSLLMCSDEYMDSPEHPRIFVSADIELQRNLFRSYHDSPKATHRGRDATLGLISRDFYWRNQAKHVRNWVKRCPHCIKFKSNQLTGQCKCKVICTLSILYRGVGTGGAGGAIAPPIILRNFVKYFSV